MTQPRSAECTPATRVCEPADSGQVVKRGIHQQSLQYHPRTFFTRVARVQLSIADTRTRHRHRIATFATLCIQMRATHNARATHSAFTLPLENQNEPFLQFFTSLILIITFPHSRMHSPWIHPPRFPPTTLQHRGLHSKVPTKSFLPCSS